MNNKVKGQGFVNWFLKIVERGGNALPHPATIFLLLALLAAVFSWLATIMGSSAIHPSEGTAILPRNLLSNEGLHFMMTSMVRNFTGFAPLGTVLVAMLGIGIAESSGLIGTGLRLLVLKAPPRLLTFVIVFAGVLSNAASEVGYVLLVPLGAIIFMAAGRHPIAGLAAAFAGVSGGYSANLILGTIDPLLAGLTEEGAQILDPNYLVNPACNMYFMIASTPLVAWLGTIVTEKIVEPLLGDYKGTEKVDKIEELKPIERKGLSNTMASVILFTELVLVSIIPWKGCLNEASVLGESGWLIVKIISIVLLGYGSFTMAWRRKGWLLIMPVAFIFYALLAFHIIPGVGFMRDPYGSLMHSPFMKSIVALIFLSAAVFGIVYGFSTKIFKNDSDVMTGMGKTIQTLGVYIVLVFFAAQFVEYFKWSNLGLIFAIKGAEFLKSLNMGAIPLMISFIGVAALFNLFMGSASAKWGLMAPIFVPMFMLLGYSPEFTQVAYRIGDSITNIISPCMSYFALIVAFVQKYDNKAGIGTVISTMLPYTFAFFFAWTLLLVVWILTGFPLGPDAGMYMK